MTAEYAFALHPLAAQDITKIWEYIAADNALAARRVREDILSSIRALAPFPNQGHRRPGLTSRPLRFIRVREYLIAYAPDEKPLWVVAVMHGHRSPRVMAAILRSREEAPQTFSTQDFSGTASAEKRRKEAGGAPPLASWVNPELKVTQFAPAFAA
jgi:toxin ParE1/3/4